MNNKSQTSGTHKDCFIKTYVVINMSTDQWIMTYSITMMILLQFSIHYLAKSFYYANIMHNALEDLFCSKSCWYSKPEPNYIRHVSCLVNTCLIAVVHDICMHTFVYTCLSVYLSVSVCLHVCLLPRLLMTSGMMWHDMDNILWLAKQVI